MNELLTFLATAPGSSLHVEALSQPRGQILLTVRRSYVDGRADFASRVCRAGDVDKAATAILKAIRPVEPTVKTTWEATT